MSICSNCDQDYEDTPDTYCERCGEDCCDDCLDGHVCQSCIDEHWYETQSHDCWLRMTDGEKDRAIKEAMR